MKKAICTAVLGFAVVLLAAVPAGAAKQAEADRGWAPVPGKIMTRWAAEVTPDRAHFEYPRPQLVRSEWMNLNGLWEYAVRPAGDDPPASFDGRILVPFPIESALSGVGKAVGPRERLWYRRVFRVPDAWKGRRVRLNFEAVDWEAIVWVNGIEVGRHRGGYDPFSFDISSALSRKGEQIIVASVWDPTDTGAQPRGKQVLKPRGIWYTAVTGIWQTVWLEPVHPVHIDQVRIVPDIENNRVRIRTVCAAPAPAHGVVIEVMDGDRSLLTTGGRAGREIVIPLEDVRLWSPDSPHLYDLRIKLEDGYGRDVDQVESYFGMRRIESAPDATGIPRLFLNGRALFHFGPLDQGWWPDGLYTAPTDAALRSDVEVIKRLGMNMLRKHVKIEPRRFYFWCDKLGVMVWQDMPSGDEYIRSRGDDLTRSPESAGQFRLELRRLIDSRFNHPSIVIWVPFNEGWGQFDSLALTGWLQGYDPTRLVDTASGWADRGVGDLHDIHSYPGPAAPPNEPERVAVLGEFGGLGLPLAGHTWQDEKNWGYKSYSSREELTAAYLDLLRKLEPLIDRGLGAAVYTQTSDVEIEINGLLTYDRELVKMDESRVAAANRRISTRLK